MAELPRYRQTVTRSGDTTTVVLAGEFDLANRDDLRATLLTELAADGTTTVHLDMAAVGFLDSTSLSVLVAAYQTAREAGQCFTITAASDQVNHVLQVTGLEAILTGSSQPPGDR